MKTPWMMAAFVLVVTGGLLWWMSAAETETAPVEAATSSVSEPSAATEMPDGDAASGMASMAGKRNSAEDAPDRTATSVPDEPAIRLKPDAVASLRRGREQGEPRTPPLVENRPEREMPGDEELADPDMYLEYEARQKQKVLASFLQASEKKVSELRAAIERAQAQGLSAEQLAEGREKLQRLEAMREEVLRDHPELAAPEEETGQEPSVSP